MKTHLNPYVEYKYEILISIRDENEFFFSVKYYQLHYYYRSNSFVYKFIPFFYTYRSRIHCTPKYKKQISYQKKILICFQTSITIS